MIPQQQTPQVDRQVRKVETFSAGQGRTRVVLELYEVGSDFLAVLCGGSAHIGAATLAEPTTGVPIRLTSLSSLGHREAELTLEFSNAMTTATGKRTLTIAGIHLDGITKLEIEAVRKAVQELSALAVTHAAKS